MLAVWFGALFGLGVLAVRVSLLENIVLAGGIDSIISSAAPPLGMKARILIALALALLGGVIGGAIGMLMARSKPSARARRAEAAAAKAAAKAARAEAAANIAAEAVPAADDETPSYFDISALDLDDDMKIETEEFAAVAPEAEPANEPQPKVEVLVEAGPETDLRPARAFDRPLDPVSFPLPESFPVPGGAAAARLTAATLDSLSHVELIERLALSLQKRREEGAELPRLKAEVLEAALADLESPVVSATVPAAIHAPAVPSYYPPAPEPVAQRFGTPAPIVETVQTGEEVQTGEAATGTYGSLLGIPRPATRPVALFPDQSPAASRQESDDTERALRDALAALQRMSGAA